MLVDKNVTCNDDLAITKLSWRKKGILYKKKHFIKVEHVRSLYDYFLLSFVISFPVMRSCLEKTLKEDFFQIYNFGKLKYVT